MSSSTLSAPDLSSGVFTDTPPRDIAVSVRGLSKSYSIAKNAAQHTSAGEAIMHKLRHPFEKVERETFWALNDVSFDIQKGDVVGIIGRNGAGKSTLLKILSRITEPTKGRIDLYGRVGSLLEVGTGFHPELTGRENIFLNGAILGMKKSEIARQFDAIVDFAGVEQFLDTPVKRYSSGMYVRLAFAVAAHLNPEILIVDEVLAVGDAEFQKKCLGKMQDVAQSGRTVLFVSHQMQAVSVLCNKALYLENGYLTYSGDVNGAIDRYTNRLSSIITTPNDPYGRPGTGELRVMSVKPLKFRFTPSEEKEIRFAITRIKPFVGKFFVTCIVLDNKGHTLLHCDSRAVNGWMDACSVYHGIFSFKTPWLKPGDYTLHMHVCSTNVIDKYEYATSFQVLPLLPYSGVCDSEATAYGEVFADFSIRRSSDGDICLNE